MKINIFRITALTVLPLMLFAGCEESSTTDINTIHGSGKIVSEIRTVDECSGISIINLGKVYLTQDTIQSIRIEADDNIIDDVISRKESEFLNVGLEDGSYSNITLNIYVSLKTIGSISINGAGNVELQNDINCDDLNCTINGAGNINLRGNGNYLNCLINGAGDIYAEEFIVERCKVLINGAGSTTVNVTEELDASVNGAGSIIYYGNPDSIKTSITGLGHITGK
ncbi:MAG: head GIN domain-containing protein [Ignavibacteria bacterium]